MKLDKAIELNKQSEQSLRKGKFTDHADAILLANEALKAFKQLRRSAVLAEDDLLPGETTDEAPNLSADQIKKLRESPLGREPGH